MNRPLTALLSAAALTGAAVSLWSSTAQAVTRSGPAAIVAMGDSAISGAQTGDIARPVMDEIRQSYHLRVAGYRGEGACLGQFYNSGGAEAYCTLDQQDGTSTRALTPGQPWTDHGTCAWTPPAGRPRPG